MEKFKKVIAKVISVITAASISLQIAASAGAEAGIDFRTDDFEVTDSVFVEDVVCHAKRKKWETTG